jgi:hypothetical protein
MTHTSMTTISLHGDMSVARRYVKKILELVALFTLAECPAEVNSTTFDRERNVVHMALCDIQAFYDTYLGVWHDFFFAVVQDADVNQRWPVASSPKA